MILYRCFAWDRQAKRAEPDGPPCSLADRALSCVVEQLARFRGQRLSPPLLRRRGLPLALAELDLEDAAPLVDLDDPAVLRRERLRPSLVATRHRDVTQPQAWKLHEQHVEAAGLRWWSTYEALWMNVTLFDRAAARLRVTSVQVLTIGDPAVLEAAQFFGLPVG